MKQYIARYKENRKRMGVLKSLHDAAYWLHSGVKTYIILAACLAINYWLYRSEVMSLLVFALSSEFIVIEWMKRYNDKQGGDFV